MHTKMSQQNCLTFGDSIALQIKRMKCYKEKETRLAFPDYGEHKFQFKPIKKEKSPISVNSAQSDTRFRGTGNEFGLT